MKSVQAKYLVATCVAAATMALLNGCASSAEKDVLTEDRTAQAQEIKCPAGYTMICEAKKVGRIRFGRMGQNNLDSCTCQPEYNSSSRPEPRMIPQ